MPEGLLILIILLSITGLIAIVSFALYKVMKVKTKDEKPTEEQSLKENLERYLQPIEDEETAKQISEYKDEEE